MRSTICYRYLKSLLVALLLSGSLSASAQDIEWRPFEAAIDSADSSNRPIFVHVWAPWCGWCHKMENEVYPKLSPELSDHFITTRINRDDHDSIHRYKGQKFTPIRLAQAFKAESVPAIVILSSSGDYLLHLSGFIKAENLDPVLKYISSNAYQQQSFETFKEQNDL